MDKEKRMAEKHTAQKRREDAELVRVLVWFGAPLWWPSWSCFF